jgi:two-component system, LytTR family, sensor histidine kinase AlgZ
MSSPDNVRPLSLRLLWLFGLNASIGLLIAITLWWFHAKGAAPLWPAYLADSLIHSGAYGAMFGLAMPYLGERLAALRFPWNWIWVVASLALIAAVATLIVQLCLFTFNLLHTEKFWPGFCYKALTVWFIALVIAVCVQAVDKLRGQIQATNLQLRTQQLEKERALKLATEARLKLLESRLHPHFLFNTLNSISALISEDPALAEQMIQRLAVLLRTLLSASTQSYVPLSEELNLVKDYIEIEKARFRERLSCSIDVTPELELLAVPPMILQPLVENSIKYTVMPRLRGGEIRISARKRSGQLVLNVWDNGSGFSIDAISVGHSIDNLQARLRTILGDTASLCIRSQDEGTMVTVCLPLMDFENYGAVTRLSS